MPRGWEVVDVEDVEELNVALAGVGGQGTIALSEVLGRAAVFQGLKVKGSEVLGMSQRGGSVLTFLRLGSGVFGPLAPEGKVHIMIAMEPSEALRNINLITKETWILLSTKAIIPPSVTLGISKYPEIDWVVEKLREFSGRLILVDIHKLALEAGSALSANMVMLGALAATSRLPISIENIKKAIAERFKGRLVEVNLKAFDLGYKYVKESFPTAY